MKQPPRFAISSPPDERGIVRLDAGETHHMRDVMRLQPGDAVTLIEEAGMRYSGTIRSFDRDSAEIQIVFTEPPRISPPLIVAPAITKGPRMDFIMEKAAELGATEVWPIVCARSVGKAPGSERIARWRRLATAASKQSLAVPPMVVREARPFSTLIQDVPRDTLPLICSAGAEPIGDVIARTMPQGILIASGPEGDFDADELVSAIAAGFVRVGLGPNRLRAETAAIAALAIAGQWFNRRGS